MYRHDGARTTSDGRANECRINVVCDYVWLNRHWSGAALRHCKPGGNEGIRRNDDLISRPDTIRTQQQVQRLQAVAYTNTMFHLTVDGKLGFKGFKLGTGDDPPRLHDQAVGLVNLVKKKKKQPKKNKKKNKHKKKQTKKHRLIRCIGGNSRARRS